MRVVIIPAYEPEKILCSIVHKVLDKGFFPVVVDDGSGELYQPIFKEIGENVVVLTHEQNKGKGRAIKTALLYILEQLPEASQIAVMDADGQHEVKDVEKVLDVAQQNTNCLVLGTRTFSKDIPIASRIGNKFTCSVFHVTSGVKVSDTQTGLRAFSKELVPLLLEVTGEKYEYEMNVLYMCAKRKISIVEVGIETIYHDQENSCSHFHKIKDSIRIYKQIIKFALSSFSSFLIDYILFGIFLFCFSKVVYGVFMSNILARLLSGTYNYFMNEKFVFQQKQNRKKAILQYIMLAICILCLNNLVLSFFMQAFHLLPMMAKIMTELTLFIISFFVQKMIIFKHQM